ncbi:MAG: hypothetical protein H6728_15015 [Myxococcales bacterium]|nr:hypothetical protein [Myxococcales bacterium]
MTKKEREWTLEERELASLSASLGRWLQGVIVGFIVLKGLSTRFYPGGTVFSKQDVGYDFWRNYLCDVMAPVALNGQINTDASILSGSGVGLLYLMGMLPVWWFLPRLWGGRPSIRWSLRLFGGLSLLGMMLMLGEGMGYHPFSHAVVSAIAAGAGFVAMGLLVLWLPWSGYGTWRLRALEWWIVGLGVLNLITYLRTQWFNVPVTVFLPTSQKLVLMALLVWLWVLAVHLQKPQH